VRPRGGLTHALGAEADLALHKLSVQRDEADALADLARVAHTAEAELVLSVSFTLSS